MSLVSLLAAKRGHTQEHHTVVLIPSHSDVARGKVEAQCCQPLQIALAFAVVRRMTGESGMVSGNPIHFSFSRAIWRSHDGSDPLTHV